MYTAGPLSEPLQAPLFTACPGIEVRETHTGVIVLAGDRAYKAKKPVLTDFLDFRDVAARERVCAHEVLLNSRLAPDGYLGVGHFSSPRGGADEPVIVMRRYPADRSLAELVAHDEPLGAAVSAIASTLARFHRTATRSPAVDAEARSSVIAGRWTENLDVLDGRLGAALSHWQLADVRRLSAQYLSGRAELFAKRIESGRIVDGHGDLLAADVFCMPDGPVMLDCLEFDDRLRYVDGLDDASFLAMDLEFLGRADLAEAFLDDYRRVADDQAPASLAYFYIAYRALVRAKVDCIRAEQGVAAAIEDARRHLLLARQHLRTATVQLVLVGGGPGSGKSTLARELAPAIGAVIISTDDVRRELADSGEMSGEPGRYGSGRYEPQCVDAVYDAALRRAAALMERGCSVILDGTWRDARHRQNARAVAEQHCCPAVELECVVGIEEALERIRLRSDTSKSEVTPAIAERMYRTAPEWPNANRIDTTQPLGDSVAEATAICCLAV